ncbi:hypothetical protein BC828DRAFT_383434 [Blastocladiella britannica]|nr:hypothetical protein BC828DRAFT_383434 [Blastocladiella britannica]
MVKQNFVGTVIRTAANECKVRVERHAVHPRVQKLIPFHKNFTCVNAEGKAQLGDVVRIESIPPVTAAKYFSVKEIVQLGVRIQDPVSRTMRAYIPDGMIKDYSKFPGKDTTRKRR